MGWSMEGVSDLRGCVLDQKCWLVRTEPSRWLSIARPITDFNYSAIVRGNVTKILKTQVVITASDGRHFRFNMNGVQVAVKNEGFDFITFDEAEANKIKEKIRATHYFRTITTQVANVHNNLNGGHRSEDITQAWLNEQASFLEDAARRLRIFWEDNAKAK